MRKLFVLMSAVVLCTGMVMAEDFEVMFYDASGALVQNTPVGVSDETGRTVQKLVGSPDGVYNVTAERGDKLLFEVFDPALGTLNKMDHRMPLNTTGPIAIDLPDGDATPQQGPANDNCEDAIPIVLDALVSGTTIGATIEPPNIPDCPGGTITAPGVWYSFAGTGDNVVATTCNLNTPPGDADYDTKISVYCLGCEEPTCVAANDDDPNSFCGFAFTSTVQFTTEGPPAEYLILVHGFGSSVGNFDMSVSVGGDGLDTIPGTSCIPPEPTGACCVQECNDPIFGSCRIITATQCTAAGGDYQGDDVPCAVPTGVSSSYNSTPNLPIPDGSPDTPAVDTINVPDAFVVADLTVDVIITHTWIGDLSIDVTGPTGLTTNMWDQRCSVTDNMDFNFSDDGTDTLCSVVAAPGVGSGQPTVAGLGPALAQFDGTEAAGDWFLTVADFVGADAGTLNFWQLNFEQGEPACVFGPVGDDDDDEDSSDDDSDNGMWWFSDEGVSGPVGLTHRVINPETAAGIGGGDDLRPNGRRSGGIGSRVPQRIGGGR